MEFPELEKKFLQWFGSFFIKWLHSVSGFRYRRSQCNNCNEHVTLIFSVVSQTTTFVQLCFQTTNENTMQTVSGSDRHISTSITDLRPSRQSTQDARKKFKIWTICLEENCLGQILVGLRWLDQKRKIKYGLNTTIITAFLCNVSIRRIKVNCSLEVKLQFICT